MGSTLSVQAYAQLRLRYRRAAAAGYLCLRAGFTVVYPDIIIGPELTEVVQYYWHNPLHVIALCPTPAVVAAREVGRSKTGYQNNAATPDFDYVLCTETPRLGFWLDDSILTVSETVDTILAHLTN
jgi:hypothetical protein